MTTCTERQGMADFSRIATVSVRVGGREPGGQVRHQRVADRDVDGVCVRRDGDSAGRRGDPPRRDRRRAGGRDRLFGQRREPDPVLAAVGAVDPERSASIGVAAVQQGPRGVRDGRRRRCAGAGEPGCRRARAARRCWVWSRGAARWRTGSTALGPRLTASRS